MATCVTIRQSSEFAAVLIVFAGVLDDWPLLVQTLFDGASLFVYIVCNEHTYVYAGVHDQIWCELHKEKETVGLVDY